MRGTLSLFVLLLLVCGCRSDKSDQTPIQAEEPIVERAAIDEVQARHADRLMAIAGVQGIYQGLGEDNAICLKIMVSELTEDLRELLPTELEGWPVEIDVTGEIGPMH